MVKKPRPPTLLKTGDATVAQYAERLESLDHRSRASWAAQCAAHVLFLFERERPTDDRPRQAVDGARSWALGKVSMMDARALAVSAHAAARACTQPAATAAARATGHAVATAHAKGHARAAASYAILAVALDSPEQTTKRILAEQQWQMDNLVSS